MDNLYELFYQQVKEIWLNNYEWCHDKEDVAYSVAEVQGLIDMVEGFEARKANNVIVDNEEYTSPFPF